MRKRDEIKEELVKQEAVKLIVETGFDGFSMQKLAKICNVSVATLYIYYQNKEDLILNLGVTEYNKMFQYSLTNFSSDMPFADGLKLQWENRAKWGLDNHLSLEFLETIRNSPYGEIVLSKCGDEFKSAMVSFVQNSIKNKELIELPFAVYWSIAFGPLYSLIRFHYEQISSGIRKYTFSYDDMYQTLELVLKSLKP